MLRHRGISIGIAGLLALQALLLFAYARRAGMRWETSVADAMLALRSVYRSIGAWNPFWRARAAA